MLIMGSFLQKFLLFLPVLLSLRFDLTSVSISTLLSTTLSSPNKLDSALSSGMLSEVFEKVFWRARLRRSLSVNIGMSESLLPWEELVIEDQDIFGSALIRFALVIFAICRDCLKRGIAKIFSAGGVTII